MITNEDADVPMAMLKYQERNNECSCFCYKAFHNYYLSETTDIISSQHFTHQRCGEAKKFPFSKCRSSKYWQKFAKERTKNGLDWRKNV